MLSSTGARAPPTFSFRYGFYFDLIFLSFFFLDRIIPSLCGVPFRGPFLVLVGKHVAAVQPRWLLPLRPALSVDHFQSEIVHF
jgi:hypothetical protein